MASATYDLFAEAIRGRQQILCSYKGAPREVCPIILGHSQGEERALTWQFAGQNHKGEAVAGEWRCLVLSAVQEARLRAGPWHSGSSHNLPQSCVARVDLDVNPSSPYQPQRKS